MQVVGNCPRHRERWAQAGVCFRNPDWYPKNDFYINMLRIAEQLFQLLLRLRLQPSKRMYISQRVTVSDTWMCR